MNFYIACHVKYLGITIQDDLGWEIHINNLLKKLRRSVAKEDIMFLNGWFEQFTILCSTLIWSMVATSGGNIKPI